MNLTQLATKRIRVRIPEKHHQEPIISNLVSDFQLTINIKGAMLGSNGKGDGWFDIDLQGSKENIDLALIYLKSLDLELWLDTANGNLLLW
jgi:ABC-type methionine transport system ATPase subunit